MYYFLILHNYFWIGNFFQDYPKMMNWNLNGLKRYRNIKMSIQMVLFCVEIILNQMISHKKDSVQEVPKSLKKCYSINFPFIRTWTFSSFLKQSETKDSKKVLCNTVLSANECGTNDKQVHFFKVPKEGLKRNQWIESISKHQQYDFYNLNFQVCELHFLSEDFTIKSGARILKPNAFPSVFEDSLSCYAADMQFNTATTYDLDLNYNSDSIFR